EAARIVVLVALLDSMIGAGEDEFDRAGFKARFGDESSKRRSRPERGPHRFVEPGLADRARVEVGAAVAGALQRDRHRDARACAEFVQAQFERAPDVAGETQAPAV